ncbi:MAG: hypothetical protein KKG04_01955 [Candidatus Thermoplasmatota archaeon]|nr:hypothetical protein [Candidatus Thermoplasmatota archaeon]
MSFNEEQITKLKVLKDKYPEKLKEELEKIDKEIFNLYCHKKKYKDTCDPSYCFFAYVGQCKYISEMQKINKELNIII